LAFTVRYPCYYYSTVLSSKHLFLIRQARQHVSADKDLGLNEQQLCTDIFTIIRSGDSDEDIQISLVELLGYEAFDFIAELISNRSTIVHNIIRMSDYDEQQLKGGRGAQPAATEARRPVYGAQFIVQSEKELREEKKLRKEQKKASKANNRVEGKKERALNL
jgi:hypothetical protein